MINRLTLKKNSPSSVYPNKYTVMVDDEPLLALVASFESQFTDTINGAYTNALTREDIEHGLCKLGGRFLPLACDCGTIECWFLVGEVTMFSEYVSWGKWENPYRSDKSKIDEDLYWEYKHFPALVFDAEQYQSEIDRVLEAT